MCVNYTFSRARNKFVHAAKKLHMCHNDYALSLINANIHQDYYRSIYSRDKHCSQSRIHKTMHFGIRESMRSL